MQLLLLLGLVSFCVVDCRPFGLNFPWSQVNQRSAPTVFRNVHGSRYGFGPQIKKPLFGLNSDFNTLTAEQKHDVIVDETKSFLNAKADLFHLADKSDNVRASTSMIPQMSEVNQDDDDAFLLRHLSQGMDLMNDFEQLIYPRGDDGF